jgi:ENTS family enterobactin (siderophore) exporter
MPLVRGLLVDLTPLRSSPTYRHLWIGGALASMGSQLTAVAVGLQVYDLSGSTMAVGFVGLAALIPLVLLGLYGGSIVDAYDRRRVLIVTLIGLCAVGVSLALLAWTGSARVGLLYVLVAVQSGFFAVHAPARSAVIPRLLPRELLPAANALATLAAGISFAVGPMLAGVLVDVAGYGWAYTAEVLLLAGALTMIFGLPSLVPEGEVRRAGVASVMEGLTFLKTKPTVGMTFFVDLCAMVLALPRVLFPAIAAMMIGGGATTVGILVAGIAIGTLLGGIFSGRLGVVRRQGLAIVVAVVMWGLFVAAFGLMAALAPGPGPDGEANAFLWPSAFFMVLAGAADTVSSVFRTTILQVSTPDALRGRLQGVFIVVVAGGPHLGSMVLGTMATLTGEAAAAIIGGLLCAAVVTLVSLRQRGLIAYDANDPGAEEQITAGTKRGEASEA